MSIDFFESQRAARRRTIILVAAYFLVILIIIPLVYLAVDLLSMGWHVLHNWGREAMTAARSFTPGPPHPGIWYPALFVRTALITALIILGASLWRIFLLSRGGAKVAEMLDGTRVDPSTKDPDERRALNVVEEMAIASGFPVPPLYIMKRARGINAFAAGLTPGTAVIAITGEAIRILSRDQLQGVVAHEFNHILSGDMQLKMWVLGILSGLCVARRFWAWVYEETGVYAVFVFFFLAPITIPITLAGEAAVWLAKLVQGSLSRQREYLADAAAVQFTRNPTGLSDALKTVGGFVSGGRVMSAYEGQTNHFFVVDALGTGPDLIPLFSSHPPLIKRIRRLDPRFDGTFHYVASTAAREKKKRQEAATVEPSERIPLSPEQAMSQIGLPEAAHLAYAIALIQDLPASFIEGLHHPVAAPAIVYAMLLSRDETVCEKQKEIVRTSATTEIGVMLETLAREKSRLKAEQIFPLAQLVIGSLRALSKAEFKTFSETAKQLVRINESIGLVEFGVQRMIRRRLASTYKHLGRPPLAYRKLEPLIPMCGRLLSCLAYCGTYDAISQQEAFEQGIRLLDPDTALDITPRKECRLGVLSEALDILEKASLRIRQRVMEACATCVLADHKATAEEIQFLQIVADALECPMPPLGAGRSV